MTRAGRRSRGRAASAALALAVAAGALSCAQVQELAGRGLPAGAAADVAELAMDAKNAWKELTPENEYYVGRSVATNLLARHGYAYVDRDRFEQGELGDVTAYVAKVGALVAAAALDDPREGDRPAPLAGFRFVVLHAAEANAFAAPGGTVFVTTGTLALARSEDELAGVLAHEVAHVVRGHGLKAIQKSRWAGVSKKILQKGAQYTSAEVAKLTERFDGALDDILSSLLEKGYAKELELEADARGAALMARAGYDPNGLRDFLGELERVHVQAGARGFAKTHPPASERIGRLAGLLAELGAAPPAPKARKRRFSRLHDAVEQLATAGAAD